MEVILKKTSKAGSILAARIVAHVVREKKHAVLGLPTGRTPRAMYEELIRLHVEKGLDFGEVSAFGLDEYVGIGVDDPGSYARYLSDHFLDKINIQESKMHFLDGLASDIPRTCREYESTIRSEGGVDLQILGIGVDGHIGFNEPSSSLSSRTRIKTLTAATRKQNAKDFGGANVPKHVLTMGIGTIMDSRQVLLMAFGTGKATAVQKALEGPITAMCPASILQMHPNAVAVLDEAAASKLKRRTYYKAVYEGKPDWQKIPST